MLRTLSLVEWEIRSVFSCTAAFCGATHSAVEHREEGVEAFRQQRVREDRIRDVGSQRAPIGSSSTLCRAAPRYIGLRVGEFCRQALAVLSVLVRSEYFMPLKASWSKAQKAFIVSGAFSSSFFSRVRFFISNMCVTPFRFWVRRF